MLNKLRTIVKNKGQGIVEYALILAFVVGIGMMLSGSNLGGAVKSLFDEVEFVLSGDIKYADALKEWGSLKRSELEKKNAKQRLTADQEALANLGSHFLSMSKADLLALLNMSDKEGDFDKLNNDGKGILIANYIDDNLNELKNNNAEAIKASFVVKNLDGSAADIVDWMKNDGTTGYAYNNQQRYFYSDTMIDPLKLDGVTTPTKNADYSNNQERSIRINFAFDEDNNVVATRVRINRDNSDPNANKSSYYKELDIKVKNGSYKQTFEGTGSMTVKESNAANKTWATKW